MKRKLVYTALIIILLIGGYWMMKANQKEKMVKEAQSRSRSIFATEL